MAILVKGQPVMSTTPALRIDNKLAPGTYTFSLTVLDSENRASAPATLTVTVAAASPPPDGGGHD